MSSPSWLSTPAPSGSAPAPAPAVDPLSIESSTEGAAGTGTGNDAADEKDLPSIILMMRLLNMGAAGALITISVGEKKIYLSLRTWSSWENKIRFSNDWSHPDELDDWFDECFLTSIRLFLWLSLYLASLIITFSCRDWNSKCVGTPHSEVSRSRGPRIGHIRHMR